MRARILILALVLSGVFMPAVHAGRKSWKKRVHDIGTEGRLQLILPRRWKESVQRSGKNPPLYITYTSRHQRFEFHITALWAQTGRDLPAIDLRDMVQETLVDYLAGGDPGKVPLRILQGDSASGYYFSVTDGEQPPGPDSYQAVTQGLVRTGPVYVSFSILAVEEDSLAVQQALRILETATYTSRQRGDTARFASLSGRSWFLLVDLPRFKIEKELHMPDGSGNTIYAINEKTGVDLSIFISESPEARSSMDCKEMLWNRAEVIQFVRSDVKVVETGSMVQVHWTVDRYLGTSLMKKNINAYIQHDGVCIDLHVSKTSYKEKDRELFTAIFDSVRFSDDP
ncbi:MAG: hypothetical protein ACE5ID_03410 [Acidobacteriota bacterium]